MLLRRVSAHIRKQEWTALGLDFLIVVLGVFVGLQVNAWNAERQDRVDEQIFIARLHDDLIQSDALTSRLRDIRLRRAATLVSATDIVFGLTPGDALSQRQCTVIASSHYYNFAAPELPTVTELVSAGRIKILRDEPLRTALVALQQTRDSLMHMISIQALGAVDLPSRYPALIQAEPYFDEASGEVVQRFACDVAAMRADQGFLNDLSAATDRNDAFRRDALAPWSEQFDEVHALVDAALRITHPEGDDT